MIQTNFEPIQVQIGKEQTELEKQGKEEEGKDTQKQNANLQAIRIDQEGMIPQFDPEIESYDLTVTNEVNEIEVLAIAQNTNAQVSITGNTELKQGLNEIRIQVISEDQSQTKTYTIQVTKTLDLALANTNLEILAIEQTTLNPPFEANVTKYQVEVSQEITDLNVLAVPENEKATVEIKGKNNLQEGNNQLMIMVTAANGFTKRNYEVQVYRRNKEEEQKYQEEQKKNQEKLEEAYEIEKTSTDPIEQTDSMQNKNSSKKQLMWEIGISFIVIIVIILGLWFYQRKKNKK